MIPTDPSTAGEILGLVKTFGLGVTVMFFFLWYLMKERAEDKKALKEQVDKTEAILKAHNAELVELSKENIATLGTLSKMVEAIAPAISASSLQARHDFDSAVEKLREHVSVQCDILKTAITHQK